jgi:hypothetical protein
MAERVDFAALQERALEGGHSRRKLPMLEMLKLPRSASPKWRFAPLRVLLALRAAAIILS